MEKSGEVEGEMCFDRVSFVYGGGETKREGGGVLSALRSPRFQNTSGRCQRYSENSLCQDLHTRLTLYRSRFSMYGAMRGNGSLAIVAG